VASPRFAVPYDVGTVNRVDRVRSYYPGIPQDELPAPPIEAQDLGGGVFSHELPAVPDVGMGVEGNRFVSPDSEIGMGIPVPEGDHVTSVDLGPAPAEGSALRALASLGGRGGFKMPAPTPSAPRRRVGSRPEFIYTNPVAARQAAENYAARLGAETGQERGYQDYAARVNESNAANDRANIFGQQQNRQLELAGQEGAANRASAERIASTSETVRQQRIAEAAWAENERAAEMGEQTAGMLNADPNARVDRKFAFLNPATGKWESRFRRQPRPVPLTGATPAAPVPPPGVPAPSLAVPQAKPVVPAVQPAAPVAAGSPSMLERGMDYAIPATIGTVNPIAGAAYRYFTR